MKKISLLTIVFPLLMNYNTSNAQSLKIGHINSSELIQLMPERKNVQKQVEEYKKQLEDQLKTMSTEYQSKVTDYQQNEKKWADAVKQTKIKEITEIEARIQEFSKSAEQDLAKKEQDLIQPLLDKVRKAIKTVSTANKYTYVFDTSSGILIEFPEQDNIISLVKKHLGIN